MYLLIVFIIPSFSLVYSVNEVGVSFGEVTSKQKEKGIAIVIKLSSIIFLIYRKCLSAIYFIHTVFNIRPFLMAVFNPGENLFKILEDL